MSTDGVHYTAIVPGQQIDVGSGGFWYRAAMQRLDANFGEAAGPLTMPGQDPSINTGTVIANITTVDMGNGVLQRSINLTDASGTMTLNETPLGTRRV